MNRSRMWRAQGACMMVLVLGGCDGDGGGQRDADASDDTVADAVEDVLDTISVDPTEDSVTDTVGDDGGGPTITLGFDVQVDGTGSSRVGELMFTDPGGTSEVLGEDLASLAYEATDWSEYGYTLFHVLAPEAGELNVMYLYCTDAGLEWVWHEDWSLAMAVETGSGSCTWSVASTSLDVPPLAELAARPDASQLIDGFTLDGADVVYSEGPGTLSWDGETFDLYPFEVVDCSTDCTADPADGWWELHSMLEGSTTGTCFGILYLLKSTTDQVQLGYPVCLDPVRVREASWLDSTWSSTSGGGAPPPGPRPMEAGHTLRPQPPLGLHVPR